MRKLFPLSIVLTVMLGCFFARVQRAQSDTVALPGVASATVSAPTTNYSLALNGTTAYVEVSNRESINLTNLVTAEAWIKTNSSAPQGIVERFKWTGAADGGFALRLTADGKLQFLTIKSNTEYDDVIGSTTVTAGAWHHVAGVFDGSQLRVYLDGSLDGAKTSIVGAGFGTANLRIGVAGDSNVNLFNGLIDEVRVTGGVRYAANFTPQRQLGCGGIILGGDDSGPRGVWNFNSQTAEDSSGHGNHGRLEGGASFAQETTTYTPQSVSYSVNINFDNVPAGTNVANYYQDIKFSTSRGAYVYTQQAFSGGAGRYDVTSYPNGVPASNFYDNFFADFPQPVNNLRFYICSGDDYGTIALLSIYQNGVLTRTVPVPGNGRIPILVDLGAANIGSVTRVVVHNITDTLGLNYDDFGFTVVPQPPPPTPTPTPTPTPNPPVPAPPILVAESGNGRIWLGWNASSLATSYNIKRRTSIDNWTTIASNVIGERYQDYNVIPENHYYYTVSANSPYGTSAESNVAQADTTASCEYPTATRPLGQFHWNAANWDLKAEVSDRDGLVVRDVSLNGRYMAEMMSVPYFYVKTSKMPVAQRGELTPDSNALTMRTRLINAEWLTQSTTGTYLDIKLRVRYAVDRLTPTSKACLLITQEYEFDGAVPGDQCEPSATLPCARFYPRVSYQFSGGGNDNLESINIPQRLHYRVDGVSGSSIGIFRDCDVPLANCGVLPGLVFERKENPVSREFAYHVIDHGRDTRTWDNLHQTWRDDIGEPPQNPLRLQFGGCPECIHTHWRWTPAAGFYFNNGRPIIGPTVGLNGPPSNQDLDVAVVRYKVGEEHPSGSYLSLLSPLENIRDPATRTLPPAPGEPLPRSRLYIMGPADVVFWYSATSYEPQADTFFKHGSFFNPSLPNADRPITVRPNSPTVEMQDGPTSITFGHLYQDAATTFTTFDPAAGGQLPSGFVTYNNIGYDLQTEALVSGPHTITFTVPSVTDQTTFANLRILHAEQDPFDPDDTIWVDRTILDPDPQAPDFAARTIRVKVNDLGRYVIALRTQTQPPVGAADLAVTVSGSPNPTVAGGALTYSIAVTNNGPQTANGVGLRDSLSADVDFVSASASQGTCKFNEGIVYCKLGILGSSGSATVTVNTKPTEALARFPAGGKPIDNTVFVAAEEDDSNLNNNAVTTSTNALPNPNNPPTVTITSPINGSAYAGQGTFFLYASATDLDGTISRIDLYDGGILLGPATALGSSLYYLSWNASYGLHTLMAVATDDRGGQTTSTAVNVLINGLASVNITSPGGGTYYSPGSSIVFTATATHSSATINDVKFYANSAFVGTGNPLGSGQYSVNWEGVQRGSYSITAVATDSTGVTTTSPPVVISVTDPPSVAIINPSDGSSFAPLPRMVVTATAQENNAQVNHVHFYANRILIGEGRSIGENRYTFTWLDVPDGFYSLTAIATDDLGATSTSAPVSVAVNQPTAAPGVYIWFDDSVPQGATQVVNNDSWSWVNANPAPYLGGAAHQSKLAAGFHQHYFYGATNALPISNSDKLYTYVFIDPSRKPRELMLQWYDGSSWEHRAYWGANTLGLGTDGTGGCRYMGDLPASAMWVRLEVPAELVDLGGRAISGMAFTLDGGQVTWDLAGKLTQQASPPASTPGEFVFLDDALPSSSTQILQDDVWSWVSSNPTPISGQLAHQSFRETSGDNIKYRMHGFTTASTRMQVNPGDILFAYVYLDANATNTPNEIMLQWHEGNSWEHRAYWGQNYIVLGLTGTESRRFMGYLPPAGRWVRLEVPASYVGLEGKIVDGMAFGIYRDQAHPRATWDKAGKATFSLSSPPTWTALTRFWRFEGRQGFGNYYYYSTVDIGRSDQGVQPQFQCYLFAAPTAGAVPLWRFRENGNARYFYTTCRTCLSSSWVLDVNGGSDGVAGYVYPDGTIPGTVPLYGYWRDRYGYFYTTTRNEIAGLTQEFIAGWVYPTNALVPVRPDSLWLRNFWGNDLSWRDNSSNETSFVIERRDVWSTDPLNLGPWSQFATVGANVTCWGNCGPIDGAPSELIEPEAPNHAYDYRVRAANEFGLSDPSNIVETCPPSWYCPLGGGSQPPSNTPPEVSIISPADNETVGNDIIIQASAFDADGFGTLGKVEFFSGTSKLGEVARAPYVFNWNNVTPGSYSLTAKVWDSTGASATSIPVNIVVGSPASSIMISEFRLRGNSDLDEFIELYNNTDTPLTVAAADESLGWSLVASDGTTRFVIPGGTTIPARGHYLAANSGGYSLSNYGGTGKAVSDQAYNLGIPDNAGVALFNTSDPTNFTFAYRLDAVGFNNPNNPVPALYREGSGLSPIGTENGEYSFTRKLDTGIPQETNDNATDFVFVSTTGGTFGGSVASVLGAPGPENLGSPFQRNATIKAAVIDPTASSTAPPNRVRDYTAVPNGSLGTLSIRRKFTNKTGMMVTRLRFRVVTVTTLGNQQAGQADVRLLDSADVVAATSAGNVTVRGTTLEQPMQSLGGGLNSTVTVQIPGGALAPNASINVQFLLGIQANGGYSFIVNVEALP